MEVYMASGILHLHNLLRWVVLAVGVVAIILSWMAVSRKSQWTGPLRTIGSAFTGVMDIQVLVGIVYYIFFSPIIKAAFQDFGAAMGNAAIRQYLVEHSLGMIVAMVLVHIGTSAAKRKNSPMPAAIYYTLALVAVFVFIPWDRALFPGM